MTRKEPTSANYLCSFHNIGDKSYLPIPFETPFPGRFILVITDLVSMDCLECVMPGSL